MSYRLIASPTVETHTENLMRLFVRDATGAPVGNAHIKVWAGPPPTGNPPYFKDDLPYRTTSPSGMLEYYAVAGSMPETRDYWMQVVANDNTPQSDPIQFHFPKGGQIWIVATIQDDGGTNPGETPMPGEVQWDPRLTGMKVSISPVAGLSPGQPYWKIVVAMYEDETQSGGNHNIYFTVLDDRGHAAVGVPVVQDWEGREPGDIPSPRFTDGNGASDYGLYSGPAGWNPKDGPGPYTAWVGDPDLRGRKLTGIPGEKLVGVGLPMNRHVNFVVTWRKTTAPEAPSTSSVVGTLSNFPAGMQVTLYGVTTRTTVPDNAGNYAFSSLPAGAYSIAVSNVGIVRSNIALDGTNSVRVDYAFPTPSLPKTSRVSGNIKNIPANTLITLSSSAFTYTTTTDATGNYLFTGVAAGTYSLAISSIGVVNASIVLDGTNAVSFSYTVQPTPSNKLLTHYLLFGAPTFSATRTNLILALDYIAVFAPTLGFSIAEAKSAKNVTIVGTGAISAIDEQSLKDAGCVVRHIAGADSYVVEQLFAQLISAGTPYPGT